MHMAGSETVEANFDGLVGPTHNYAGLAHGNIASAGNKGSISQPRAAALQGLRKMKFLADLGVPQAVLPPQPRPRRDVLQALGYGPDFAQIPAHLLAQCYSASCMWTANAATVSPGVDTKDGRLHFTPANLVSGFHRSLEAAQTTRILRQIFADAQHFAVHDPLPAQADYADEGAANILRLSAHHGEAGLEVHVFGRDAARPEEAPRRFPARQTKQACEAIFRRHGVQNSLVLQQSPEAIDAGVFHNDVISIANESVLFAHEKTFAAADAFSHIQARCGDWLQILLVQESEVSLAEAVQSYLFNTQIIRLPDGSMAIIAPRECEENARVHAALTRIRDANDNPISAVHYLDLRESMRNGGGPACLRLRVVLTQAQRAAVHPGIWLTEKLYAELVTWVEKHYRETLSPADLTDPSLATETEAALAELSTILGLSI